MRISRGRKKGIPPQSVICQYPWMSLPRNALGECDTQGVSSTRRTLIVALALGAAALTGSVAPGSWDEGVGSLEVFVHGERVVATVVEVGATRPILDSSDGGGVRLSAPGGVPTNTIVEVEIDVDDPTVELANIRVAVVLPDGDRQTVPVLTKSDEGTFFAARRPPVRVGVVLGLLAAVIVLWVSEVIPIFVTALAVPVVLTLTGTAPARDALAPFFDPIIVLFFAGFLMAEAMRRVELDRMIALIVVAKAGRSPTVLFATLISISAFMSMWMSNTAAVAVLIPIALSITAPIQHPGYRKAVVLGLAYAATIGGVGSAIGTPANLLAIEFVNAVTGREITFLEWFAFGLPLVLTFLPIMGIYLWRISRVTVDPHVFAHARREAIVQRQQLDVFSRRQWAVATVFAAVLGGWLTQSWHGQSPGVIALAGAVVMFGAGLIETDDLQEISWPTLLTFGGGLTLGVFMVETGTSDWLVSHLGALQSWPTSWAIAAAALLALALTTVASNTGSAATLIPLAIPFASVVGVNPVLMVAVIAIASSVDFALVVGTPPTMMAYSTDLFSVREILRKGAVLDLIGITLLVTVAVWLWQQFGIV